MTQMIGGLVIFLGVHSISIVNEQWRDRMAERFGVWTWKGIYSLASLVGLVMVIRGYSDARADVIELYIPPAWLQHLSLVLLIPIFTLLVAAYVPGRIKTTTQHPMLLATILWATAHLLTNGTLVDVILFGSILLWGLADLLSVNRRESRQIPGAPPARYNDLIAVVVGLGLYIAILFWLHELLFGVAPL